MQSKTEGAAAARLALIPAVIGVTLALLYAVGAIYKASELHDAGLSTAETLSLIPIQQLLTRGAAVVLDGLPQIVLWTVVMGAIVVRTVRQYDPVHAELEDLRRRHDSLVGNRARLRERTEQLEKQVEDHLDPDSDEELRRESKALLQDLEAYEQELDAGVTDSQSLLRRVPLSRAERWTMGHETLVKVLGVTLVTLIIATATVVFAVVIGVTFLIVNRMGTESIVSRIRPSLLIVLGFAIFGFGALVQGAIYPNSLPETTLALTSGKTVKGGLIATTGSSWYVTQGTGGYVGYDASSVKQAQVAHAQEHRPPRVFEVVVDRFR